MKTRIKFYVYKERPGDEDHQYDLIKNSSHDSLEEAKIAMDKITEKLYARIERWEEEYTPAPNGRQYKNEEFGWEHIKSEVVLEN